MRVFAALFILLFIPFVYICSDRSIEGVEPLGLRCEYGINPLGVENKNPRLSWILQSDKHNQKQTAYQILVSANEEKLNNDTGDFWDSGKVESDRSVHVTYKGEELNSGMRCRWKVRVWDKDGNVSVWSEPAFWEMGLLNPTDWKADWIGCDCGSAPMLRREFKIDKPVKDARVYISGLGYYELSINGSKVGDHVLDPGQTDYEQRTFYVVYDVTKILKQGGNAVGVILGDGWYNQTAVNHGRYGWKDVVYGRPRLILQTHIFYTDGSEQTLVSDESWRGAPGPITFNNVYAGEHYDARLEKPGWDSPGYDDSGWEQVKIVDSPGGKLVSQKLPAIKRMQTIKPVSIKNPKAGVYVYDMGQNFSGWVKLKIEAGEGTIIRLRFAEWLNEDGTIDPASTGTYATGVVQTDKYICKGAGIEVWEPRFTYHGFQYVEVTGFPGTPALENIEGVVVHTSVEKAGKFECSDEMINRIHRTALWTEVSNMHGIPTDCPHRERCGWLGDGFLTSDMTMYNFNAATFWAKFIRDIDTMRRGGVPDNIAPGRRSGGSDPDWGAAFIQLPWNMYLYYGDKSILDEHYAGMSYFMNHLQKIAEDNIIYKGIGSLFSPGRIRPKNTPREFTSTIMYYFSAGAMSRIAGITDRDEDAEKYYKLAQSIKPAFNKKFYNEKEKTYGCQENDCLALAFGLVPEGDETGVAGSLNKYVVEVSNGHLSTGVFGSLYMYSVLGRYGYGDTAMEILNKETFPSIGYLFSLGATTFWENWGENKFEDRKGDPHGRSKSHPFRSGFDMWFYNGVAGINPDPENPGFKHIIFQPHMISTLKSAKAEYQSIHGLIKSEWRKIDDTFRWSVSIPVNTTAAVYVPAESVDSVMLNGAPAAESKIVEYVGMKNGSALFNVGSGDYTFIVKKN